MPTATPMSYEAISRYSEIPEIDQRVIPAYMIAMKNFSTIEQTKQQIIEEFAFFDDWIQRYEYIVDLGKNLDGLPEELKIEAYRVSGCQSQVWIRVRRQGSRIYFDADSDAVIVRGLIALLLRIYSGRTPDEILATPPAFFEVLELGSHLSGNRANGLHAMVKHIHACARTVHDEPLKHASREAVT